MNTFIFFHNGIFEFFFFLFSQKVQILKTGYKYGQYCTSPSQSDCRYFFVYAITTNNKLITFLLSFSTLFFAIFILFCHALFSCELLIAQSNSEKAY